MFYQLIAALTHLLYAPRVAYAVVLIPVEDN